jgi:hypothetical protein
VDRLVIPRKVFGPQGADHGVGRHGKVPFVVRGIGAPNVLWRRGTSCLFRATFLQTNCLFLGVWGQETRTASLRTARLEMSPWTGNPVARAQAFPPGKSRGRARGVTTLGRTAGTPGDREAVRAACRMTERGRR